jgi:hypothetical protein
MVELLVTTTTTTTEAECFPETTVPIDLPAWNSNSLVSLISHKYGQPLWNVTLLVLFSWRQTIVFLDNAAHIINLLLQHVTVLTVRAFISHKPNRISSVIPDVSYSSGRRFKFRFGYRLLWDLSWFYVGDRDVRMHRRWHGFRYTQNVTWMPVCTGSDTDSVAQRKFCTEGDTISVTHRRWHWYYCMRITLYIESDADPM